MKARARWACRAPRKIRPMAGRPLHRRARPIKLSNRGLGVHLPVSSLKKRFRFGLERLTFSTTCEVKLAPKARGPKYSPFIQILGNKKT